MKKTTNIFWLMLAAIFLFADMAYSQNMTFDGTATYTACSTGSIVIRNSTGTIANTTGNTIGTTSAARIEGTVVWASTSGTQQTAKDMYYTNMTVSGASTKSINDPHVSGDYTIVGGTGTRSYTGTFYYDGSGGTGQNIAADGGTTAGVSNNYNNLKFEGTAGSVKYLAGPATVEYYANGNLVTDAGVTTNVTGTFKFGQGATPAASTITGDFEIQSTGYVTNANSDATFANSVTLSAGGSTGAQFVMEAGKNGDVTFNGLVDVLATGGSVTNNSTSTSATMTVGASGTFQLGNAADAKLALGTDAKMVVTGSFLNNYCTLSNTTYDVSSIMHYNGAGTQNVVPTIAGNQYGNLWLDGDKVVGGNTCGTGQDVYVANLFALAGGNFDVYASSSKLVLTDPSKLAVYNDAVAHTTSNNAAGSEVIGAMRILGSTAQQMVTGTAYRFNNDQMLATFASGTFADGNYFQITNRPSVNPYQFAAATDVNRKITVDYTVPGFVTNIQASYLASETGTWGAAAAPYGENSIRFWESTSSFIEKVATGDTYNRSQAGTLHAVAYGKIEQSAAAVDGVADKYFTTGSDLVLRGGPTTFYTIRDGRWSNPDTWDEGVQPGASDNAEVRHTVHAGYTRVAVDNYQLAEQHPTTLAANIVIDAPSVGYPNASLIFGGGGVASGDVNNFFLSPAGTITNNSFGTGPASLATNPESAAGTTQWQGLYFVAAGSAGANNVLNTGTMGNCGTVLVGD